MGFQNPILGPHLEAPIWGYPAEFSLVYKGFLHYTLPGGGSKQGSQTPYWGLILGPRSGE